MMHGICSAGVPNSPLLTVAICTHNPRPDYFQRVVESLQVQTLPRQDWQLLVIDNCSDPPLAQNWDLAWHPLAQWVVEPELGLTNARLCAIKHAKSNLLIFLDDDNISDPDYLENAYEIFKANPDLGAFGAAAIVPEFESSPPAWMEEFLPMLALRTVDHDYVSNRPTGGYRPWGAGLCITRAVADAYLDQATSNSIGISLDRKGNLLLSGGDDLFSLVAIKLGMNFGVFRSLRILHLIASKRLDFNYMKRLAHGHSYSAVMLAKIMNQSITNPFQRPSIKAAAGLAINGRFDLCRRELKNLIHYRTAPSQAKAVMDSKAMGWQEAVADLSSAAVQRRS